jgi:hypothetical protein
MQHKCRIGRSLQAVVAPSLMQRVAGDVGYGITRETGKLTPMNEVVVVLKYQTYNGMPYYILTAYVG